jgi:hypothetical protein
MNGFDPVYGARPLRRLVQSSIGDQLAKELLAGEVREGDTVRVDLDPTAEGGTGALVVGRALPWSRVVARPRSPGAPWAPGLLHAPIAARARCSRESVRSARMFRLGRTLAALMLHRAPSVRRGS